MTIRAGYFGTTAKFAVSSTPDGITVEGANESRHTFLVQSEKTIHIERSGADASPDTSLRIPANTPVLIATFAGDAISFVLGAGESDGSVWLTKTDF